MADKVLLHVGAPKTGTSFLQDRLFHNPDALAAQGISYPAERPDSQFLAALDLMQVTWGGLERQAGGQWDQLADRVRSATETVVVSHEILGFASREHVARALESFGAGEVHVLVSARDLVRQIPAEWQENVKHRRKFSYAEFLEQIRDPDRSSSVGAWFWGVQEVPAILARWGDTLPVDRVHVITVPQSGAPRNLLWERFATAFGIGVDSLPDGTNRDNPSLGVPETALVRDLNVELDNVVANERYRQFVRELLVHQTLSRGQTSARLSVPPDVFDWASGLCEQWAAEIAAAGYDVIGDLADLTPGEPIPWVDPDQPDADGLAAAGFKGLTAMVKEAARLRDVEVELHQIIERMDREIDDYHATLGFRVRNKVVRSARDSDTVHYALAAYRRLRGRD